MPIMLTLVLREITEQVLLEYISGYKKEKVTGNSEHGSTKDISCPTNLLSFYDEMTGHVGEGWAMDVILQQGFHHCFPQDSCIQVKMIWSEQVSNYTNKKKVGWLGSEGSCQWVILYLEMSNNWSTTEVYPRTCLTSLLRILDRWQGSVSLNLQV